MRIWSKTSGPSGPGSLLDRIWYDSAQEGDMEETCEYFKYVPHHQQKIWEDAGWVFDKDLGPPHAAYASLYKWPHDRAPVVPDNTGVIIIKAHPKEASDNL